jgi:hypothetical protein
LLLENCIVMEWFSAGIAKKLDRLIEQRFEGVLRDSQLDMCTGSSRWIAYIHMMNSMGRDLHSIFSKGAYLIPRHIGSPDFSCEV